MDKFKIFTIAGVVIGIISGVRISYDDYQKKKQLEREKFELTSQIEQLQRTIARNNQIVADNEQLKRELENLSIERQEQTHELLKNNNCANQLVPVAVSDSLYNRAQNLRQPADTSKPIKWLRTGTAT